MAVHPLPVPPPQVELLLRRALRYRRRGEARRALVTFREACAFDDRSVRAFVLYGVLCRELGRDNDASDAFRHALWLRKQFKQPRRAQALLGWMARTGLGRQCA